jgi:hypothetical protein
MRRAQIASREIGLSVNSCRRMRLFCHCGPDRADCRLDSQSHYMVLGKLRLGAAQTALKGAEMVLEIQSTASRD